MLARPLWKTEETLTNFVRLWKHLRKEWEKVPVNFLGLFLSSPSSPPLKQSVLTHSILSGTTLQGGPPASSLYRNLGEAKREKINGASLDVSSRRCKQKTKRILQDPRRLTSRFQREPERWDDGYIWEIVTWFSYKQDNSCKQESKSEERLSPLWFGVYYLRSVQVELWLLQQ